MVNPIGSLTAFTFGALLRLLSGEEVLSLPVYLRWPNYDDEKDIQYFPFKSVIMILTFIMLLLSSFAAKAARLDHLLRYENYELHSEYGESPSKEELQPTPPAVSPPDTDHEADTFESGLQNEAYF